MGGLFLDIFAEYFIRALFHAVYVVRSHNWSTVKATVLSADCPKTSYGCTVATVYYEYVVGGKKYGDMFEKPFILHVSGKDYADQLAKGMNFDVRVKPDDATKSVPLWGDASLA